MITYKDSGVDVEAGYEAVRLMKEHVKSTFTDGVLGDLGSFGGFFQILDIKKYKNPVLVSGTDGVGTKLQVAFKMGKHDTVGIDAVAMCVNDILCQGAKPLFFLDYIACGKLVPDRIAGIVKGVAEGCRMAGTALIGGETAEMPGFYSRDEYDIAGFAVGIVDRDKIINGREIKKGDVLIGLPSSGLHSNGYSLIRKLFKADEYEIYNKKLGCTIGQELLKPTRIYADIVVKLLEQYKIKGMAHITGGGFIENIPRMLPKGLKASVYKGSWVIPQVFQLIRKRSSLDDIHLFNTFNMGIGLVMAVDAESAKEVLAYLKLSGENASIIGEVSEGEAGVEIC